jgi:hypothetical protein
MRNIFGAGRLHNMEKSKFGKYVAYAAGEIVLVVAGILIAYRSTT